MSSNADRDLNFEPSKFPSILHTLTKASVYEPESDTGVADL